MKVLFDTNVILDVLLERKPHAKVAALLVSKVEKGRLVGYLGATTITTLDYLIQKQFGAQKAKSVLQKLLRLFEVAAVNKSVLLGAFEQRFSDFEDAVLYEAACQVGLEGIVTRNIRDFKSAQLPVYSPSELLQVLDKKLIT